MEGGNPAKDFLQQEQCFDNRTRLDSSLSDGCDVWREENQLIFSSELTHHQVQYWGRQRTRFSGLSGRNTGRAQQLVPLEDKLRKTLENCICWTQSLVQYPEDGVES